MPKLTQEQFEFMMYLLEIGDPVEALDRFVEIMHEEKLDVKYLYRAIEITMRKFEKRRT